jgi:hypothetical protein
VPVYCSIELGIIATVMEKVNPSKEAEVVFETSLQLICRIETVGIARREFKLDTEE